MVGLNVLIELNMCCDLRTDVGNVSVSAMSLPDNYPESGVGNVGAPATSLPVTYPEFGPRRRRCIDNVVAW